MKVANMIAAGAALAAGLVGGTATYLVAAQPAPSSEAPPVRTVESDTSPAPTVRSNKPIVKLAPCTPPAVREGRSCVTELVETVVLPAPSSGTAGAPTSGLEPAGDDEGDQESTATDDADGEDGDHADGNHEADHEDDADDDADDDQAGDEADEDDGHEDEGQDDEGYDD